MKLSLLHEGGIRPVSGYGPGTIRKSSETDPMLRRLQVRNPALYKYLKRTEELGPETPPPQKPAVPPPDINTYRGLINSVSRAKGLNWTRLAEFGSDLSREDFTANWGIMPKYRKMRYAVLYKYHPSMFDTLPNTDELATLAHSEQRGGGRGNRPVPVGKTFGGMKR